MTQHKSIVKYHCVAVLLANIALIFPRERPSLSSIFFEEPEFSVIILNSLIENQFRMI